jgi:hypothetical protein
MADDLTVRIPLGDANAELLDLDANELVLDLGEVEIGDSVEVQRRLGLTPRGLVMGLALPPAGWDAVVTLAAVWLALRQAGRPTRWDAIKIKTYLPHLAPTGGEGGDEGKASPTPPEPSSD